MQQFQQQLDARVVEGKLAKDERAPSALAFSIHEFCRRHGISRAHFYNLAKAGTAPKMMHVGRRTLISVEAAEEWRRRMENFG